MRVLAGIAVGITLTILAHTLGWPFIGWLLTRVLPVTPEGWAPRVRIWHDGTEVEAWPIEFPGCEE